MDFNWFLFPILKIIVLHQLLYYSVCVLNVTFHANC